MSLKMKPGQIGVHWKHTNAALLSLTASVKCKICDKLPEDPHLLWCKHSFCKECIQKLPQCPECNYPVKSQELVRNIMLDRLLQTIKSSSEMMSSYSSIEGRTEERVKTILPSTTETSISTNKKNNIQQCSKRNCSEIKLLEETKKENNFSLRDKSKLKEKNKQIDNKNKLDKSVIKTSNNNITKNPNVVEKTITSKTTSTNARDKKSLHSSSKESIPESLKTLKNIDINLGRNNDGCKTPKSKALSSNCSPKSCILFSAKKVQTSNKVNVKGETPLQIACRLGKLDLVRKLLGEGAEPNVKDYANWTPLCDAVGSGNMEVVRVLLEAGAGVNIPSNQNTTALVEAVEKKDITMVKLLMKYGADMHQRTALNNTALSIADDEMRSVLMSAGNSPVQPYPRVKQPTRAVLAAKLSPEHMNKLMPFCQKFNLTLSTNFMEDISHIVVEKTEDNHCHGSVPVMIGILNGCTVVGTDWVAACLEKNKLLPADGFEPNGTDDYPNTNVFLRARLNKEHLLPRLFDGCHISLQHDQFWPENHKHDIIALIQASGAVYQPRQCDAERILPSEQTVMFHTPTDSPLALVSHIILFQPGPSEPLLKYNMAHVKTLSVSWFVRCIKTFALSI